MRRLLIAAVKISAIAALILAGSSCTSSRSTYATADLGGVWPDWQDIDEGGFEEMGWVLWPEAVAYHDAKALVGSTARTPDYEFYRPRQGFARLCPFRTYVPLYVSGSVANRIVLDQAAASGRMVHVSGRQRSGLRPG
ncbi:MAG TPA: hypothetical protein VD994_10010, partial [Prosthecobacter sp.]|nr:hypothetical protein [Prosthecobacter sp.]